MENKKAVFITIVVLLCIFAPLTIVGFIYKDDKNLLEENPNHEIFYKGHIWFYDAQDKFLSKYECMTEICDFTTPTIDDSAYGIKYYKNGEMTKVPVIDNKYTFITDGALIYLYDAENGYTLGNYKSLKNYNTTVSNNSFIIQNNEGLWGVLNINATGLSKPIEFEYDFIGLMAQMGENNTLNANQFIVKKDNKWYLVDNKNSAITGYIDDPIVEYNSKYVFSRNTERVRIYSYENYEYLTNYTIKDYILEGDYIGIITSQFLLIYNDLGVDYIKAVSLANVNGEISLEKNANKLNIKVNNEVIESVELS